MTDLRCEEDFDLYGRELDDPIAELEQDLWHRLIERPGENIDDEDRGCGIQDLLSADFDAPAIKHRIIADFKKDLRVDSVTVDILEEEIGIFRAVIAVQGSAKELGIVAEINTISGTITRLDA